MCVDDTDIIKEAFNFLYLYPVLQYAYYSSLLITWKSQQMMAQEPNLAWIYPYYTLNFIGTWLCLFIYVLSVFLWSSSRAE